MGQQVKNTVAMQETQILSLDQVDVLEKEMASHSSILAWKIPWTAWETTVHGIHKEHINSLGAMGSGLICFRMKDLL